MLVGGVGLIGCMGLLRKHLWAWWLMMAFFSAAASSAAGDVSFRVARGYSYVGLALSQLLGAAAAVALMCWWRSEFTGEMESPESARGAGDNGTAVKERRIRGAS
jgi:hypothetical protein